MSLHIKKLEFKGFEEVIEIKDASCGLHAFIAIHDTTLGPAVGGIRFLNYDSPDEALTDVLRLAEGMTYKSSLAGLPAGGGKSTVIWDPKKPKPEKLLQSFAEAINYLGGRYIGAEDMNCFLEDIEVLHRFSPHILGLPGDEGTGDPARFTAYGVFLGAQATAQYLWGTPSLHERKVLIQGVGGVGYKLLKHLFWAGARLYISDLNPEVVRKAAHEYGATIVAPEDVYSIECDIFAPCARGGILNSKNIPLLRCKAVVGAANNQLLNSEDGQALTAKNILYAPDYLVNAGGVIDVVSGLNPTEMHPQKVLFKTEQIFDRLLQVYELAEKAQACTASTADQLALQIIQDAQEHKNALV